MKDWNDREEPNPNEPEDRPEGMGQIRLRPIGACIFEVAVGLLGLGFLWLARIPLKDLFPWDKKAFALGVFSVFPPFFLMLYLSESHSQVGQVLRHFMVRQLMPLFRRWRLWHFACLSLCSGIGEELLFRGALLFWIERSAGWFAGVFVSGILFGLFHPIRLWYMVMAMAMGWYLGWLVAMSGSLVPAILTHAGYNFLTLWWFRRLEERERRIAGSPSEE